MAARSLGVALTQSSKLLFRSIRSQQNNALAKRQMTTNESGGVLDRPEQVKQGLVKVALIVVPFTYVGAIISREFAAWLEEHELFVPSDDDDDD